jgi:hypothetical protein
MKILSYKILNEAAFQVGGPKSGLLGANLIARSTGDETFSNTFFKKIIRLDFEIIDAQNQQPVGKYKQVLFAINYSSDKQTAYLYPYISKEVDALSEVNGMKWGNLQLFDKQTNAPINIEGQFLNPQPDTFKFEFKIGDPNSFSVVNSKYKFSKLNDLKNYVSNGPNTRYLLKLDSSTIMRDISNSGGGGSQAQNRSNNYKLTLTFNPSLAQQFTINPTQPYTIIFNNSPNPRRTTPVFSGTNIQATNTTSIKETNSNKILMYIYTKDPMGQIVTRDTDCFVHIPNVTSEPKPPIQTKYKLSALQQI